MRPPVEFFYGIGSRYSYLASTQLKRLAAETGCHFRWRPLFSGDLFAARGRDPFAGPPVSGQYDWGYRRRDAARWAAYYGVRYREPEDVAYDPRRLALAATAAARLGVVEPFSRRLFQAMFVDGLSPLDDEACARLAQEVGLDREAFLRARVSRDRGPAGVDGRAGSRVGRVRRAELRPRRPSLFRQRPPGAPAPRAVESRRHARLTRVAGFSSERSVCSRYPAARPAGLL